MNIPLLTISAAAQFDVEVRIVVIMVALLALAAFIMSAFSAFLFYRFYRDTIKPVAELIFNNSEGACSLHLKNNGHSAFYVHRVYFTRNGKVTSTLPDLLPFTSEETFFSMFATQIEGRKVMPDQQVRIFDLDLAYLAATLSGEELQRLLGSLNGIGIEMHFHDIGKRYKTASFLTIQMH